MTFATIPNDLSCVLVIQIVQGSIIGSFIYATGANLSKYVNLYLQVIVD